MPYTFNCDGCHERKDHSPPFMGEFSETFLKTTGGAFAAQFKPGQTVTLCEMCCEKVLL